MLRTRHLVVLTLFASSLAATQLAAATTPPRIVAYPATLPAHTPLRAVAPTTPVRLEFDLAPNNQSALSALALSVANPTSPNFHSYLASATFSTRFGALPRGITELSQSLKAAGFHALNLGADHLVLFATATAAEASAYLHTSLFAAQVSHGTYIVNTTTATIPANLAGVVLAVNGLNALPRAQSHAVAAPSSSQGSVASCASAKNLAHATSGPYTPWQLAKSYGFTYSAPITPKRVALYELSTYDPTSLRAYDSCFGLTPTVATRMVDGGTKDASGNLEVLLDTEIVASLAPTSPIDIYTGPNTDAGWLDTLRAIATDNKDAVVSISWGSCESQVSPATLQAENAIFAEMAVQGQSVLVASGDTGAQGCLPITGDFSTQATDPASQPLVTAVGGTALVNTTCQYPSCEVVWNFNGNAGGGGASMYWPAPDYQSALGFSSRAFPDIAANAAPLSGYLVYDQSDYFSQSGSGWGVVGGTSAAAPLEAAMLADTLASCPSRIGLWNETLYQVPTASFKDITVGSNDTTYVNYNLYAAKPGYDQASGLGVPLWNNPSTLVCP